MQFRTMQLADLTPADYNPRKALKPGDKEYEKLRRSLEEFGCVDPLIWNERTGRLVGGHQRLSVLIDLGWTETQVSVVDLPEEKEKALNIALNKIAGEWDMDRLRDLLVDLEDADIDVTLTGFDTTELAEFLPSFADDNEVLEDGFDAEKEAAAITVPDTHPGDLYILGRHRLLCGDSTITADIELLMNSRQADLVCIDPPYNVDYHNDDGQGLQNDNLPEPQFREMLTAAFRNIFQATREGGCIYICHSDIIGHIFRLAMIEAGFMLKQCLVWVKNSAVLSRQDYNWQHEPILYGWKPGHAHYFCQDFSLTTVLQEDRPQRNALHPTMKPLALIGRLIRNSTPARNDILVLDGFGGSGSTLIACEQIGRDCNLMEVDPVYCDVIVKRWEQFTGKKAELIRSGVDEGAAAQVEDLGGMVPVETPGGLVGDYAG